MLAKTDYAANCGDQSANEIDGGPPTLAKGWTTKDNNITNGIIFRRSQIHVREIVKGTSNVYLVGERYMNALEYETGMDPSDNETMYVGYDNDVCRSSNLQPKQDVPGVNATNVYGSVHPGGFIMAYCDGHVDIINYDIALAVFKSGGNRKEK